MKKVLRSLLVCVVVAVLAFAEIDGMSPFALAFLFATLAVPVGKILPAITLILAELWRQPEQLHIIGVVFAVAILILLLILQRFWRNKRTLNWLWIGLGWLLAQSFAIYVGVLHQDLLVKTLLAVVIGVIFFIASYLCLKAIQRKKFTLPWTVDQIVCLLCVVMMLALGLCGFANPYFDVHHFVALLIILCGVFYADPKATVMVAAAFGLGRAFAMTDLVYVAIDVLLCIVCVIFKHKNRFYSLVALLFTDLVIGIYFGAYPLYNAWSLLPLVAATVIFLCLPSSVAKYFTFGGGGLGGFLVSKNTINRNTAGISMRMRSLAAVFNEMQNTYRHLTRDALPPHENAVMLCSEITSNICANCAHKKVCCKTTAATKDMEDGITALIKLGLKRGEVCLLDVPNTLSIKCTRINTLLNAVNQIVTTNKNKAQIIAGLDSGKILMANLLSGVSQLCSKFANDVCRSVVFDNERGELVKEELLYRNIYAEDCLITKTSQNEFVVSVLVPRADATNARIEKVVSQVCGHKMIVDEVVDADTKGYAIVAVRSAPKYHVLFGMAGVSKGVNQPSGDNYSFLRVTNEKTLMALCDGMGTGERASRASILALSLVENFYKAGFPDDIIMYSVNQLLTFTGQDVFSALDMCVFDLATGDTDFIKVGAADGFIKRAREVEIVEAGSLPLGILDDIEPKITKTVLSAGDLVILVSDGVLDAFGGDRMALAGMINNLDVTAPQLVADQIIAAVLARAAKSPADDCTVTVAQLTKM